MSETRRDSDSSENGRESVNDSDFEEENRMRLQEADTVIDIDSDSDSNRDSDSDGSVDYNNRSNMLDIIKKIKKAIDEIKIKYDNKEPITDLVKSLLEGGVFSDLTKGYVIILQFLVDKNPSENTNNELLEKKISNLIIERNHPNYKHKKRHIKTCLYSYLYFGLVPEYLLNVNENYHLEYFMWKTPGLNTILDTELASLKEKYNTLNKREKAIIISKIDNQHSSKDIIKYLFKITKGREISDNDTIKYSLTDQVYWYDINNYIDAKDMIHNYMYYGFVPAFLSNEELHDKQMDTFYFRWQKEDDPNRMIQPIGLEITKENYAQWKYWSEEQLKAFYFKNVLPLILKQAGLDINPELPTYKNLLMFDGCYYYKKYIKSFITQGNVFLPETIITKIKEFKEQVTREFIHNIYREINRSNPVLIIQLFRVKAEQNEIRANLNSKLHKLANKNNFTRFKWQGLCSSKSLSELELEELQELALIDHVPRFLTMSKRELCVEFAERFTKLIKSKNEIKGKCFNDTSIITLEELKDIPPEFFFSYTQKDSKGVSRTYCDDIRALNDHFKEENELRNPYTNVPLKESFVIRIKEWYNYLTHITHNMDDEGEIIEVSLGSQLSSKMTSLVSKFIQNPVYHNNGQFFVDSNEEKYKLFINKLTEHSVLNEQDSRELLGLTQLNLIQRKMMLIDKLMARIRNDSQQMTINGQRTGAIALDIAEIYNNTFI